MKQTQPARIILILILLALLLTWPLALHLGSHVTGDGIDDPALAWNLWWAKYSWVDRAGVEGLVHNPFDGDFMFYPLGINLAFYTLTLLNGALSIPLQGAFSLIVANNLLLLSSFVLGGLGAYLLMLELWAMVGLRPAVGPEPRAAAGLAAMIYAFASAKLFYAALGQFNIASSQWLPFVALYLLRSFRLPWRWRDGLLLGLFLLLQTWAELTFGTFGVLLIALVTLGALAYGLWLGWRRHVWNAFTRAGAVFRNAAIAAVMFVAGLSPYLAAMLPDMRRQGDFLVEGGGFADIFSADLLGFFFPTQLHPLFGGLIRYLAHDSALQADRSQWMVNKGQHIFLGYSVMVLALWALWHYRRHLWARSLALLTALFGVLALGPSLRLAGHDTGLPGLFPLLAKIPFLQANRYPSRFSVLIVLGAGLLAGLGLALARQRWPLSRRRSLTLLVAGLVLFEHLSVPLPLSDFRPPLIYRQIAADAPGGAILDLPLGWRNGFNVFGKSDVVIMFTQWYQTYHHLPRLGGNTSRNPEQKFQYFMENPVIGVLAALQDGRPLAGEDWQRAQELAPALLRSYNIRTVTLHRDKVPPDFPERLQALFPLQPVAEAGGIVRYAVQWPPQRAAVTLTPAAPELLSYLDQGWGVPSAGTEAELRWAQDEAGLILPGWEKGAALTLDLFAPAPLNLRFVLDGRQLGSESLHEGDNQISLNIPPAAGGFPHHLQILADSHVSPAVWQGADLTIGSTGVRSPVNLVLRSAGKQTGDFAHLYVNGHDVSVNQRGYNLAALQPESGDLLGSAVFDTHAPYLTGENERMIAWIEALPPGTIVIGAVRDAAALSLSDGGIAALRSLGVAGDIRGALRRAHAFVGVKGAPAGSALEATADEWPVTLVVGEGITGERPAYALRQLRWQVER